MMTPIRRLTAICERLSGQERDRHSMGWRERAVGLGIGMPSYGMFIDSKGQLLHPDAVELESVFETLNPAEAQLIRSRLEAAGLDAEVDPEIDPLCVGGFSLPSGGIQIKVPADQASEARAILDAGERAEG